MIYCALSLNTLVLTTKHITIVGSRKISQKIKIKNPSKFYQKPKNPLKCRQEIQKSIENSYYRFFIVSLGPQTAQIAPLPAVGC